jgi:ribokinase
MVLEQAGSQGIDVSHVARRGRTALLLDVVDQSGQRRLFEHVPEDALLSVADVDAASALLGSASTVSLQLQQPADALLAAAHIAHDAGARIVLDGTIEAPARDELLRLAHVVRADAGEAAALTGQPVDNRDEAQRAARQLLAAGAAIVAVEAPGQGDLVVWPAGMEFLPHASNVVDPTGGGDAFLAGLIAGLRLGSDVRAAAQFAAQAAASTVARLGGRPELGRLAP